MAGFMRNRTGVVFHLDQGLLNNAELGFVACTVDGGDLPVHRTVMAQIVTTEPAVDTVLTTAAVVPKIAVKRKRA